MKILKAARSEVKKFFLNHIMFSNVLGDCVYKIEFFLHFYYSSIIALERVKVDKVDKIQSKKGL